MYLLVARLGARVDIRKLIEPLLDAPATTASGGR
jgi:hypothetical protein